MYLALAQSRRKKKWVILRVRRSICDKTAFASASASGAVYSAARHSFILLADDRMSLHPTENKPILPHRTPPLPDSNTP